ncbi:unnamed protein product, partial [Phaeothamnion confervicola]
RGGAAADACGGRQRPPRPARPPPAAHQRQVSQITGAFSPAFRRSLRKTILLVTGDFEGNVIAATTVAAVVAVAPTATATALCCSAVLPSFRFEPTVLFLHVLSLLCLFLGRRALERETARREQ